MTEQVLPEGGTPVENTEQQVQEREYSEIEIKAIEQGWIPKEEFDGDESTFIDAPEFVRRGELFSRIEKQSKELKAVRQALEAFRIHHSKVKEVEYERALKTLKDAKRQATIEGDHERALALDDKIEEVRGEKELISQEARQIAVQEQEEGYTPQFQSWVDRNSWYETNMVMRKTADVLGQELSQKGYSPAEVLDMVEREIKREFKHKFTNPNLNKPQAVEGSTRSGKSVKSDDFEMTPEEIQIMRQIVKVTPGYTEARYKAELKATRK